MTKEEIVREEPMSFVFICPCCKEKVDVSELEENHEAIRDILNTAVAAFRNQS